MLMRLTRPNGAKESISGYPGAAHKRLNNEREAQQFDKDFQQMRDQVESYTSARTSGPARNMVDYHSAGPVQREYIDRWPATPFHSTQDPINYLSAAFGSGMYIRGSLSGGTRLIRTDPDGTTWTREDVYNCNFETMPRHENRQTRGFRSTPNDNNEGRIQDVEPCYQSTTTRSMPSHFEEPYETGYSPTCWPIDDKS